MHELESTQRLIWQAMIGGLLIAALLALIGGAVTSRTSLRRIGAINATVAEIMAGDLSRRIPADDTGDDFSQLVDNLNRMLDRIESLLEGVKQVSDNIAHDLRTPLARLRNRLDELTKDEGLGESREAVEGAIREADGLLATFGALLRIARIESGARHDTGPGIPEADRDAVFRRFHRLDTSRTSPGTGLGLSLVRAVASLHHLEIRLEDQRPGLRAALVWRRAWAADSPPGPGPDAA